MGVEGNAENSNNTRDEWLEYWTKEYKRQFRDKPPMDLIILCFSLVNYESFLNVEKKWYKLISVNSSLKNIPILLVATFKDVRDRYISKYPQTFAENWRFEKSTDLNNNAETQPKSASNNNNRTSKSVWTSIQAMQKNLENIKPRKNTLKRQLGPTPPLLLNVDIIKIVFSFLDIQSVARCEQVCKKWWETLQWVHKGNIFDMFRCPCIPTIYVCLSLVFYSHYQVEYMRRKIGASKMLEINCVQYFEEKYMNAHHQREPREEWEGPGGTVQPDVENVWRTAAKLFYMDAHARFYKED